MKVTAFIKFCFMIVLIISSSSAAGEVEEEYFAIFMEGAKVGHAINIREVEEEEVFTEHTVEITISRFNIPISIKSIETYVETTAGEPLRMMGENYLSGIPMIIKGIIKEDGKLDITYSGAGMDKTITKEWPEGALLSEGIRLLSEQKGLEEGMSYSMKIFYTALMQSVDVHIVIGAREEIDLLGRVVNLTKVSSTMMMPNAGPILSVGYVDDENKLQKEKTNIAGISVEMIACEKEFALGENDVLELVNKMFVASPEPLGDERQLKSVHYFLAPTNEEAKLNFPSLDNQTVKQLGNGKVMVTVAPVSAAESADFPYAGEDEKILGAMQPSRCLQSDDERVIKLAKKAIGNTKDTEEAVRKIESFVADYLVNKGLSVGYATAIEVAESKQGDCTEYAVLSAAMCRAVGIPSRVVMGLAYVENYMGLEHRFGGHAWTEAYVGSKWIGIDPAFKGAGLGGYGPGHIALAAGNGNPEDFFAIVNSMGQFEIEKVEIIKK
ncbi:MAG: transglutaminase-like domain-containing protein [Planctomycetota bacterium]|jgi:hypothetical protein